VSYRGGKQCAAAIPVDVNIAEFVVNAIVAGLIYRFGGFHKIFLSMYDTADKIINKNPAKKPLFFAVFDVVFAVIHFGMWFQVLYYKINLHSLVNLLQPCHISLLSYGFAATMDGPASALITVLVLPETLVGAAAALAVPATDGLDQPFEKISFFIQHYLLLITPLYLLVRNRFVAYKIATLPAMTLSLLCIWLQHVVIYAVSGSFDFDNFGLDRLKLT
jgi:TMEM164 family